MQIEISKVEVSKNPKVILITGKDGKMCSGFVFSQKGESTGLANLKVGDIIEAEISIGGDYGEYRNLKSFKLVSHQEPAPPGAVPPPAPPKPAPTPDKKPEISGPEHGLGMKIVGDLFIAGKLEKDHPLVVKMWAELNRIMGVGK